MTDVQPGVEKASDNERVLLSSPMNWLPGAPLPAELQTGHPAIDFEHSQLLACMNTLRSLCQEFTTKSDCSSCESGKREGCETQLVALLGDLLAFILEHFRSEEEVMRNSSLLIVDRDVCEAHMEDHANISAKVQEIIVALEPTKTVVLLRELDMLLQSWIRNHIMLHDVMLGRWLESRGEALSFS